MGPTAASSYVFLVPVFGVLVGGSLLDEEIGASMAIGLSDRLGSQSRAEGK